MNEMKLLRKKKAKNCLYCLLSLWIEHVVLLCLRQSAIHLVCDVTDWSNFRLADLTLTSIINSIWFFGNFLRFCFLILIFSWLFPTFEAVVTFFSFAYSSVLVLLLLAALCLVKKRKRNSFVFLWKKLSKISL